MVICKIYVKAYVSATKICRIPSTVKGSINKKFDMNSRMVIYALS
jgi:hypothetical protein